MAPKLTAAEAAKLTGYSLAGWRSITSESGGRTGTFGPPPDGVSYPCGCRWWYEETVINWLAARR